MLEVLGVGADSATNSPVTLGNFPQALVSPTVKGAVRLVQLFSIIFLNFSSRILL